MASFRWYRAVNRTRGTAVADRVQVADTAWTRTRGLLGRSGMEAGEALYIVPCRAIHTFFMRFAIDAAFVDAEGRVLKVARGLRPFRTTGAARAAAVLETAAGALAGTLMEGEVLALEPLGEAIS